MEKELTSGQLGAFRSCIDSDRSLFCTGGAGSGKTYLLNKVKDALRERCSSADAVAITASTSIAAYHIGGITLHSFAGLGLGNGSDEDLISRAQSSRTAARWKAVSCLIIDEVSMVSASFFRSLDIVAKAVRCNDTPFGGIRLIMFGDFLQLPPVLKRREPREYLFNCPSWVQLRPMVHYLREDIRHKDPVFVSTLSKLRMGICTDEMEAYIQGLSRDLALDGEAKPTHLFARKSAVDELNEQMLDEIPGDIKEFQSIDTGKDYLLAQCPLPPLIRLKTGCQVMLIRNLGPDLPNGANGIVRGFARKPRHGRDPFPVVSFLDRDENSSLYVMEPSCWQIVVDGIESSRIQFPIALSRAITIHKSQGTTIPYVCVDMNDIFEKGHAYVALSRCPHPDNLQVINFDKDTVMADKECVKYYALLEAIAPDGSLTVCVQDYVDKAGLSEADPEATDVASATEPWDPTAAETLAGMSALDIEEKSPIEKVLEDPSYDSGIDKESVIDMLSDIRDVVMGLKKHVRVPLPRNGVPPLTSLRFDSKHAAERLPVKQHSRRAKAFSLSHTMEYAEVGRAPIGEDTGQPSMMEDMIDEITSAISEPHRDQGQPDFVEHVPLRDGPTETTNDAKAMQNGDEVHTANLPPRRARRVRIT